MSNNTSTPKVTFWSFLNDHTIEIPIIQRDYAQGRKGKEELRKTFLTSLRDALDNKQELTLDFVYGFNANDRFNPLDGQQRLTTLWLLHWYVAYKADELANASATLKKFSYETRVSSREFCERLSEFNTPKPDDFNGTISDFIQQQTWFYSAWKQDPTIQSMLRMLSGTPNKDKTGQEIIDGLEELFSDTDKFKSYWESLSGADCPIHFYTLDLLGLNLTDDLYIKMNARGEQLTSFENFKADLIGYLSEQKWTEFLDPELGIPIKMDTAWTDIFWKNNKAGKIDDLFFAFLNRFFLNDFISRSGETVDNIKDGQIYKLLYGSGSNDSKVTYQGFGKYEACITKESLTALQKTLDAFTMFTGDGAGFQPNWSNNKKELMFIPEYTEADGTPTITTLTQPQRVVFYAICKYFEKDNYEDDSFKHWMRVVWNLVENGTIETIDSMVANIRLIDELSVYSHDIYTFLDKCYENGEIKGITSQANSDQLREEIEKAEQILAGSEWEDKIINAEKYAAGAIRFLFRNENGNVEWADFDEKFKVAKKIFTTADTKLVDFVKYCMNFSQLQEIIYDDLKPTWKINLLNAKLVSVVHNFLLGTTIPVPNDDKFPNNDKYPQVYKDLTETDLLQHLCYNTTKIYGCHLRTDKNNQIALFPNGAVSEKKKYVVANPRNAILSKAIEDKKIECAQKVEGCNFFWGWDIEFQYSGSYFEWNKNGQIYLKDDDEKYRRSLPCIDISNADVLINKLEELLQN